MREIIWKTIARYTSPFYSVGNRSHPEETSREGAEEILFPTKAKSEMHRSDGRVSRLLQSGPYFTC